ncbi:hypothetical protein SRB5_14320 [Streptomyces sp. RB5]|uniref:DUF4429 domain-containing protein n=1 Tax=Streptomyces smaragdinus TaxID=2585196 RepID=A0A7K0CCW7_9ACTN|nr:DUF4429 domain-containing protein [Streptomyces smaragdinus]MQY11317.1 hypothetical protein [Streptomyces smaragdinus]
MSRMGDVLSGLHASWEFDSDSVLIRYERGIRTPRLLHALTERRIPLEALRSVGISPGKRGTVVLRLVPRQGADPVFDVSAGQLKESCDPYRLVLPESRATLAEYYADEIRPGLGGEGECEQLVAAPEPPLHFKAYDAKASFDGTAVSFRWFWTGASSAKWKAGDQTFAVTELEGVEWRSPEGLAGHLRLLPAGGGRTPGAADQDPASVVFGLGYGSVQESLPFAAAVLSAIRAAGPARARAQQVRTDPSDIADRIRHLGALHRDGILTDAEFSAKKAELLAEL